MWVWCIHIQTQTSPLLLQTHTHRQTEVEAKLTRGGGGGREKGFSWKMYVQHHLLQIDFLTAFWTPENTTHTQNEKYRSKSKKLNPVFLPQEQKFYGETFSIFVHCTLACARGRFFLPLRPRKYTYSQWKRSSSLV